MLRFSPNPNRASLIRWRDWGEEAFRAARGEDRPLMIFLGAFWCGWCQRMDENAFSDDENITLLNAYFVPVRVENAKRPDVDLRYQRNGWPTIAFLSPGGDLLATAGYLGAEQFGSLLARVVFGYEKVKGETGDSPAAQPMPVAGSGAEPSEISARRVSEISETLMKLADGIHGGFGCGQKFLHPEANDFFLHRFETAADRRCLEQVCLTLDRMRDSPIHDRDEGGYYRTASGEDWGEPHREKLLADQAGLLINCLGAFRLTRRSRYREMAEEIVDYVNRKLTPPSGPGFYGCEDSVRSVASGKSFSIVDDCLYADANARTIVAYLKASRILERTDCRERALTALEFFWNDCHDAEGGIFHYHDDIARVSGLLSDQVHMGTAFVEAFRDTGDTRHLERARALARLVLENFTNPAGGYFDVRDEGPAYLRYRLTLMEQNAAAAAFFLSLARAAEDSAFREAARWALAAFPGDFRAYGVHAAVFGQALSRYLEG